MVYRCRTVSGALLIALSLAGPAAAQDAEAAASYNAQYPALRQAAPDVVVGRLRQRATAVLSPLPGFEPGSRIVDLMVERPWPALRRRCTERSAALGLTEALVLADDMLRDARVSSAAPADRGALAAMLAALDGRVCACADKPSLSLAADCAS